ncbi:SPRY domain-containing protein [Paenibacillus amylolyticus]|uniref:SPRY domain-containing protein n=1 Tax=Paenibacillus amylolyticus TaxID=1451 RepID=UPI00344DE312
MSISWRSFTGVSLSNNDLTATLPTQLQSIIATGNGVSSGKWYWEVLVQSAGAIVGVTSTTTGGQIWNTVNHRGYFSGAAKWGGTSGTSYGATFGLGDVISVLLDMDAGTIEFWKNGVTQGVAFNNVKSLGTVYPFYGNPTGTSIPSTATAKFERKAFSYQVPQGYLQYDIKHKILLSSGDKYYSLLNDGIQETTSIPKMTSNTTPEGEVLVSNSPSGNATFGWEAFDGGLSTTWGGNTLPTTMPKWIGYKFIIPKVIVKYRLYVTNTTYYPRNYEFQGSNDGINYDTLHSIVGGSSGVLDYVIPNRKPYSHYRLYITVLSNGVTLPSIMELQMFEMKPSYLVQMESATEADFLNRGIGELNDFNQILITKKNLIKGNTVLGSGKVFEHAIDMSRRRVDKITLG